MTDENLGQLLAQAVNLGNLHGTDSKEFVDFVSKHNDPELLKLLEMAFSYKDILLSEVIIYEELTWAYKSAILIFTAMGTSIGLIAGMFLGYLIKF